MDLRKRFPRSMRAMLAGYAHLPRMIDKCRAVLAGTEGEYIYPCPIDELLMEFAGITSEEFTAAVKRIQRMKGLRPGSAGRQSIVNRRKWPPGTKSSWRGGRLLRRARSGSNNISTPSTRPERILRHGPIFRIWRKDVQYFHAPQRIMPSTFEKSSDHTPTALDRSSGVHRGSAASGPKSSRESAITTKSEPDL